MRVIEDGEKFNYLKDAITTNNCTAEVIGKQLVLGISSKERFLDTVETYSMGVALRNSERCGVVGGYTYFTRLFFSGKIKLYKTESIITSDLNSTTVSAGESESEIIYNNIKATPYGISGYHLKFLSFSSESEAHTINLQANSVMVAGGSGICGIINVGSGVKISFTLKAVTSKTSTGANRILRIYKKNDDNSVGDIVFEQEFNGTTTTTFNFTLPEGAYYLRQPASVYYQYLSETNNNGGDTTIKINFQDGVIGSSAKIYKYNETSKVLSLVASTDFSTDENKVLTTVNQDYIDGSGGIYYLAAYTASDTNLIGMNCNVAAYLDPLICFKYNGQSNNFSITDSKISQSLETFSASINTIENT